MGYVQAIVARLESRYGWIEETLGDAVISITLERLPNKGILRVEVAATYPGKEYTSAWHEDWKLSELQGGE
jgi:hypothetical protein